VIIDDEVRMIFFGPVESEGTHKNPSGTNEAEPRVTREARTFLVIM
jgi:hypothetical protein